MYAGYGRGIMMTFTLPWIRSRYNSEGFKVWQEPDKDYRARVGDERWAWYTENTLEENAQLIYKTWSSITRKFQRDTGVRLQYIASVELTRAGAPHLHVVVPESFAVLVCGNWGKIYNAKRLMIGLLQRQISQWFVTAWCTRTAEASNHGSTHFFPRTASLCAETWRNIQHFLQRPRSIGRYSLRIEIHPEGYGRVAVASQT